MIGKLVFWCQSQHVCLSSLCSWTWVSALLMLITAWRPSMSLSFGCEALLLCPVSHNLFSLLISCPNLSAIKTVTHTLGSKYRRRSPIRHTRALPLTSWSTRTWLIFNSSSAVIINQFQQHRWMWPWQYRSTFSPFALVNSNFMWSSAKKCVNILLLQLRHFVYFTPGRVTTRN